MKRDFYHPEISMEAACPFGGPLEAGWKRGVTLVELLVASLIMVVVTGAAFTLFKVSTTYESRQQELLTQTQNLRAALYAVSRDVRMAGSGMPLIGAPVINIWVDPALYDADTQSNDPVGWFTYADETTPGVRAIFGTDSGTDRNKSDTLTIFRSELESTTSLGQLKATFTPGSSNELVLQDSVTEGETFSNDHILAISNGSEAVIVQVTAGKGVSSDRLTIGPRFKPGAPLPGGNDFPAGSIVYNLRDISFVTYYVDTTNHRLMANYHDATLVDEDADNSANKGLVTVADNIEDFQVAYYYFNRNKADLTLDAKINLERLDNDGDEVHAVQLAMVARSKKASGLNAGETAVEVMGHQAKDEKGFTRRVLSEIVQLRNF